MLSRARVRCKRVVSEVAPSRRCPNQTLYREIPEMKVIIV